MTKKRLLTALLGCCVVLCGASAKAQEPIYSSELMKHHPYRFHSGLGPSPGGVPPSKSFRPGYGYQKSNAFDSKRSPLRSRSYLQNYSNGIRNQAGSRRGYFVTPWYLPGTPSGPTIGWPQW